MTDDPCIPVSRSAVVIGYGNTLRGDDAVGPCVATAVGKWGWPGVQTLAVPQLTPELAAVVAGACLVVFVDACTAQDGHSPHIRALRAAESPPALDHTSDPRSLLALAQVLYGCHPPAWWVAVPGQNFELGAGITPAARTGMAVALRQIGRLVREFRRASDTQHQL
jgi:hydrogenase maturation protease